MKKIILSVSMIAAVAALVWGSSRAFFSDTETSLNNEFELGTIDIEVDGQNPWKNSWENYLDKPMETNYMNFTIKNIGENPAKVWKRLTNIASSEGIEKYECVNPTDKGCGTAVEMTSSEPECEDGTANGAQCYVPRNNLAAFMVYDMAYCVKGAPLGEGGDACVCDVEGKPEDLDDKTGGAPIAEGACWVTIIDETKQIRVDNVADTWIQLTRDLTDGLAPNAEMVVSQSYRVMTWDDANQPMVTNWAQGDTMTFDVELDARQMSAPAPGDGTAYLVAKNTTTWEPDTTKGEADLTYNPSGDKFEYSIMANSMTPSTEFQLIYYPDPWANPKTILRIGSPFTTDVSGTANVMGASFDIGESIPFTDDDNSPAGAKLWIVPTASLSGNNLNWTNVDQFLFDTTLISHEDTNP